MFFRKRSKEILSIEDIYNANFKKDQCREAIEILNSECIAAINNGQDRYDDYIKEYVYNKDGGEVEYWEIEYTYPYNTKKEPKSVFPVYVRNKDISEIFKRNIEKELVNLGYKGFKVQIIQLGPYKSKPDENRFEPFEYQYYNYRFKILLQNLSSNNDIFDKFRLSTQESDFL